MALEDSPNARGLSPRVRGIPQLSARLDAPAGSIPACAGDPVQHRKVSGGGGVYPRVCGGSCVWVGVIGVQAGLSPRVRGIR